MPIPARLTFVTLGAHDVQALAGFYRSLGFAVLVDTADFVCFETRNALLGLFDLGELAKDAQAPANVPDGDGIRGFALAINVDERDEVDSTIEAARAAGARITKEPVDWSCSPAGTPTSPTRRATSGMSRGCRGTTRWRSRCGAPRASRTSGAGRRQPRQMRRIVRFAVGKPTRSLSRPVSVTVTRSACERFSSRRFAADSLSVTVAVLPPPIVNVFEPRLERLELRIRYRDSARRTSDSAPLSRRRRPSFAVEERTPARRDAVAALQALGQAERLQLPHVGLERQPLATKRLRELGRAGGGRRIDDGERRPRPRPVGRAGVQPGEPRAQVGALLRRDRRPLAERRARIDAAGAEPDPIELLVSLRQEREQCVPRSEAGARLRRPR